MSSLKENESLYMFKPWNKYKYFCMTFKEEKISKSGFSFIFDPWKEYLKMI